jgi:HSP20 family molecular chaperone IbpA
VRRTMYRLEIPYGRFERRVPLPTVQVELKQREFRDGYLIMAFDKLQSA